MGSDRQLKKAAFKEIKHRKNLNTRRDLSRKLRRFAAAARGRSEVVVAFDGETALIRAPIDIRVLDNPLDLLQAAGEADRAAA